jgi:hypothetical protein
MISQLQTPAIRVLSNRLQTEAAELIQKTPKALYLPTEDKHKQICLLQLSYKFSVRDARSCALSRDRKVQTLEKILCAL